jgi:hypothetical protein
MRLCLDQLIVADRSNPGLMVDFCISHFDRLDDIFINCGNDDVNLLFTDFIAKIIGLDTRDESFNLMKLIFNLLSKAMSISWRQTTKIAKCIATPLAFHDKMELALRDNWGVNAVISFISLVFESQRATIVFQNLDLSPIFEIATRFFEQTLDPLFVGVVKFAQSAMLSTSHADKYLGLVAHLFQADLITIETFVKATAPGKTESPATFCPVLISVLLSCTDAAKVETIMQIALRPANIDIFTSRLRADLTSNNKIASFLLQFPKETVFKMFLSEASATRRCIFDVIKEIFNPRYSRPISLSIVQQEQLNKLFDQAIASLRALDDLDRFARSPGTSTDDFQLVPFLKFLRWALASLQRSDRPTFDFCVNLYHKLEACHKFPVNYHLLQTISVLLQFPADFVSTLFVQLFSKTMQIAEATHENSRYARFFIRFGRYLEHITADQLSVIVSHRKIASLLGDLPGYDHRRKCWPNLVGALEARTGDPACAAALAHVLNGTTSSVTTANLATYLPLLQPGVNLKTDTIERFLDVIDSAFTSRTTSVEHFRTACQFQLALLSHECVRPRIDPCDPFCFKHVVLNVVGEPEKLTIARGFFRGLIKCNGLAVASAVQKALRPARDVESAFLILAAAVDAGADVSEAFWGANASVAIMLEAMAQLLPMGEPVPKWARDFLVASAREIQYGSVNQEGRDFAYQVIEGLEFEEAKEFLRNLYRGDVSPIGHDRHIAEAVFKKFPDEREVLMEVFPLEEEYPFASRLRSIGAYDRSDFDY